MVVLAIWSIPFVENLETSRCHNLHIDFGNEIFAFEQAPNLKNLSLNSVGFEVDESFVKGIPPDIRYPGTLNDSNLKNLPFNSVESELVSAAAGIPPDIHYSHFSGTYEADFDDKPHSRPKYYEGGKGKESGMFYYCSDESAWVFTILPIANAHSDSFPASKCEYGWLLKSPITIERSLDNVPSEGWTVWNGKETLASEISKACISCSVDSECSQGRGTCDDTNQCRCHEGFMGPFCEFDQPQSPLVQISETMNQPTVGPFETIKGVSAYNRPVFVWETDGASQFQILLFSGLRWYLTVVKADRYNEFLAQIRESRFHAYWGNLIERDVWSYSEETDAFVPTGNLKWFPISANFAHPVEDHHRFESLLIDCSKRNICGPAGTCVDNSMPRINKSTIVKDKFVSISNHEQVMRGGKCMCVGGYRGHFCEIPPGR